MGKTGTLVSPPARLPSAFFQMKTDMWRFPPSLSGRGSLQTDEKEPAVHQQSAERSAALCSPLSLLLQHPPHAGTTAASVAVRPANNLQRAINFLFPPPLLLPPTCSVRPPSFPFFLSLFLIVLHLFIYLSDIQLLLSVHACKHFFVLSLRLKEHRADCYLHVHAVCQEESSYIQNVNFNSLKQQEHLSLYGWLLPPAEDGQRVSFVFWQDEKNHSKDHSRHVWGFRPTDSSQTRFYLESVFIPYYNKSSSLNSLSSL